MNGSIVFELPFYKGISVWSVVNICQSTASQATCFLGCFDVGNINQSLSLLDIAPTNYLYMFITSEEVIPSSGLNHVCMIQVHYHDDILTNTTIYTVNCFVVVIRHSTTMPHSSASHLSVSLVSFYHQKSLCQYTIALFSFQRTPLTSRVSLYNITLFLSLVNSFYIFYQLFSKY